MTKKIDTHALIGTTYNRLTVIATSGNVDRYGASILDCRCLCGKQCTALAHQLLSGRKKSCGCLKHETNRGIARRHGHASHINTSPEYRSWHSMITRCTNPQSQNWNYYGGRGISVC